MEFLINTSSWDGIQYSQYCGAYNMGYIYNSSNSTRYFGLPKQGVYLQFDGNVDGDDDDDATDLRVLRFKTNPDMKGDLGNEQGHFKGDHSFKHVDFTSDHLFRRQKSFYTLFVPGYYTSEYD